MSGVSERGGLRRSALARACSGACLALLMAGLAFNGDGWQACTYAALISRGLLSAMVATAAAPRPPRARIDRPRRARAILLLAMWCAVLTLIESRGARGLVIRLARAVSTVGMETD